MEDFSKVTSNKIIESEGNLSSKSKYKKINSTFGYFGSKNKIALQLCSELPQHYCWVEAFCGSASLTLSKVPAKIEVINDIDGEIVNVFKQLRSNSVELCRLISLTPYAKEELEFARMVNDDDSELERARKFLVQAMMAINGAFGENRGGFSYSQSYSRKGREARVNRWYNFPDRLSKVVERLRDVRIENRDARELLNMFLHRPASLVYLDPPYLGERSKGYTNDANEKSFHMELLELANQAKCMIFISGYQNEIYEHLLSKKSGWQRKTIDTITKNHKGETFIRDEIVWTNKHFQKAVKSGKVPIKLSDWEIKEQKLNPERI